MDSKFSTDTLIQGNTKPKTKEQVQAEETKKADDAKKNKPADESAELDKLITSLTEQLDHLKARRASLGNSDD